MVHKRNEGKDDCCEKTHHDSQYSPGYYWLGNDTLKVPLVLHKENRERLVSRMLTNHKDTIEKNSFILLEGGKDEMSYDTDHEPLFKQERYFFWTFGCEIPGCYGLVGLDDKATSVLAIPKLPADYATWMGEIHSKEYYKSIFLVDHVIYTEDLQDYLKGNNASTLYTILGLNTDSGATFKEPEFPGMKENFKVNNSVLFPEIAECRVIKTPKEVEVIRYAVDASVSAHKHVMRTVKVGMKEYECESEFVHHAYKNWGCRNVGYTCICAANKNSAVLHYGHAGEPNASTISEHGFCLFDMGAEYHSYTADITCSFPATGKFSPEQRVIYNAVLDASVAVIQAMRPGVNWIDMHKLAERCILEALLKANILKGDLLDLVKNGIGSVFFPHGLGHFLGLNTHDVGGFVGDCKPKTNSLRTTRDLKANMVITVEPGCYFIKHLLTQALADPIKVQFFNQQELQKYVNIGGVRIEDDVLVTENGCENLSKDLPRTCEEIEEFMKKY
ncbi:hypothetical protein DICPUDRAFT_54167 [Dictyostelium purpureum]|uniref:Xaa-Pro dipeptidase n=1 Tax=Dictyostelium purpureum TaxID=5786 RepID=F0ZFU8_DICPU|nr:uncharacterized protein DICPUDRAFT_54167 [Dictyostelium purpureum]EGC37176.1 hypothetical protein DICPUDRAFT_54167 [Dictyostelium purpureum]|eukprot:XP_003286304.1 hypothetical protein DICPUDRAFT_54167 [Dictyostelium purpureum]